MIVIYHDTTASVDNQHDDDTVIKIVKPQKL